MSGYPPPYPPPGPPPGQDWKYQRRILKEQARAQRDFARAQRDTYRAQMDGLRRTSLVGPLLIIVMGVVFLLLQIGRIGYLAFWNWYAHWWPLLLVGIGVVLLIEWVFDRNSEAEGTIRRRHTIGGGTVILLIFLILLGLVTSDANIHPNGKTWTFGHWQGLPFNDDNLDQFFGDKHESDQTIDHAFPANSALIVTNPRGDVAISGTSDDQQLHITVHKQVYTRSDSEAESRAKNFTPQIATASGSSAAGTADIVTVAMPSLEGSQADLTITVPAATPVTVNTNHGDVHANSLKAPVNITANHGDIEVSAISGPVLAKANNSGSSVSGHNINGPLTLDGRARDITLSDIGGLVSLSGDFFGTTHLEHIRGPVRFHTSRTDLQLARLDGEIEISPNADLSASEALGPVTLTTRNRDVSLERVSGDLSVTNRNGSVDLTTAPPLGNVTVENRSGSVKVTVPEQSSFTVQAQTSDGDTWNDFSLPTQETNNRKNFGGTVGKGGSLIRINTSDGDISLKKANVAPLPPTPPAPPIVSIQGPEGSKVIVTKDGTRITSGEDGSSVIITKGGTHITSSADGNNVYVGKNGTHLTINPDGTTVYQGADGTRYTSTPDGTRVYVGTNGVRITATPDGRIIAIGANGRTLSDAEARDHLRHADDLVRQAQEAERREKSAAIQNR